MQPTISTAVQVERRALLGSDDPRDDVVEFTAGSFRLAVDVEIVEDRPAGDRPVAHLAAVDTDNLRLCDLARLHAIFSSPKLVELLDKAIAANGGRLA